MLNAFVVSIRFIFLILAGQKQVALENAALRQQLAVFKRHVPRPKLHNRDRLFWIGLYLIWAGLEIRFDFRAAGNRNVLASQAVQTVLGWRLSQPKRTGRPRTGAEIRKLIQTYSCAACSVRKNRNVREGYLHHHPRMEAR